MLLSAKQIKNFFLATMVVLLLTVGASTIFVSSAGAVSADAGEQAAAACRARGDRWDGATGRCLTRISDQSACQTAGGSWRQVSGAPQGVMACYCTAGNAITYGTCSSADTGGNNVNTSEPSYVENDCNDPSGITQDNCGIIRYLVIFINVLSALVGVVVVGSIIYGGIQYSMAGSDPQKVAAAKERIRNALIALFFFLFMYALLNYLVPGGVL